MWICLPWRAFAMPYVRMVPDQVQPEGGTAAVFDRVPPWDRRFTVELPDDHYKSVTLEVWNGSCDLDQAHRRQHQVVPMVLSDDVFRGVVAPLQEGQPYCFKTTAGSSLPGVETRTQLQIQADGDRATTEGVLRGTNFVSIDLGLAMAVPTAPKSAISAPWFVPYVGLNIYFTAVDRRLSLTRLVDFRQIISLTVGLGLTTPKLNGFSVRSPLADHYPLVGVGFRVSQYVRLSAGSFIYWWSDSNPASRETHAGAAPFLSVSGDLDLIDLISRACGH